MAAVGDWRLPAGGSPPGSPPVEEEEWDDVLAAIEGGDLSLDRVLVAEAAAGVGADEAARRGTLMAGLSRVADAVAGDAALLPLLDRHRRGGAAALEGVRTALDRDVPRLAAHAGAVASLQYRVQDAAAALANTQAVSAAVGAFVEMVTLPPQAARVLATADSAVGLGPQFMQELGVLAAMLRARSRGHIVVPRHALSPAGRRAAAVFVRLSEREITEETLATIPVDAAPAFAESAAVVLELVAAVVAKAHNFLVRTLGDTVGRPRTNLSVQQHNVLPDFAPLVAFLRDAAPAAFPPGDGNPAAAAYRSVVATYTAALSPVYAGNMQRYLAACNGLEEDWAARQRRLGGGSEKPRGGLGGLFGGGAAALPLVAAPDEGLAPEAFGLGPREAVLRGIFAVPVIPHVNRQRGARHAYEETFRSANVLLCDAVASEFRFTYSFFARDTEVYVAVMKPTVQLLVDYVADVVLRDAQTRAAPPPGAAGAERFPGCAAPPLLTHDHVGLLLLIRICHVLRAQMHARRLRCLDGYFDSVLLQLWPAFQAAFQRQGQSLRACGPTPAVALLGQLRGAARLRAVHPVVARYAELALSMMVMGRPLVEVADRPPSTGASTPSAAGRSAATPLSEGRAPAGRLPPALSDSQAFSLDREEAPSLRAAEAADDGRFAVLAANLSALRLDLERFVQQTGSAVVVAERAAGNGAALAHGFAVNNLYHVLRRWSGDAASSDAQGGALPRDASFSLALDGLGAAYGAGGDGGFFETTAAAPEDSGSPHGAGGGAGGHLETVAADAVEAAMGGGGALPATIAARLASGGADFGALRDALGAARTALAEEVASRSFGDFIAAVLSAERAAAAADPAAPEDDAARRAARAAVEAATGRLQQAHRGCAEALVAAVLDAVADRHNALGVAKLAATQVLLYNTRLAAAAAAGFGRDAAGARRALVANAQLLQAMRAAMTRGVGSRQ